MKAVPDVIEVHPAGSLDTPFDTTDLPLVGADDPRTRLIRDAASSGSMGIVLFVCVENTFRSVMSEALFNAHPPVGWRAESAGVRAADSINPLAVDLLKEVGVSVDVTAPRTVTDEMVRRATRVVTFGCLDRCPIAAAGKAEDWPVSGATGRTWTELREIRDDLRRRIDELRARIERDGLREASAKGS